MYANAWLDQASAMQKKDSQFLGAAFEAVQDYMVTDLTKDAYLDAGLAAMQTENLFEDDHFSQCREPGQRDWSTTSFTRMRRRWKN